MLKPPCQHNVAIEPVRPRCDLSKRHADLESNSSLFWKDAYRPKLTNCSDHLVEQGSNLRTLATEVVSEIVPATCV